MKKLYTLTSALFLGAFLFMSSNVMGQNLLINGDFETGMAAPWVVQGATPINIDSVTVHSGNYAAHGNVEQLVALTAGKNYILESWAYNKTPTVSTWVGIRDMVGAVLVQNYALDSAGFQYVRIEFTAQNTGDYKFWVWGETGADYYSDSWVLFEEGTSVSTTSIDTEDKIKIYNNPAVGVAVNFEDSYKNATINVVDLTGKIVYTTNVTDAQTVISTDKFNATGIYVIQVKTDKIRASKKVMIVK